MIIKPQNKYIKSYGYNNIPVHQKLLQIML